LWHLGTVYQEANSIETSYDTLIDLLKSIKHFFRCINIYTQIPHTTALDEIVVKIIIELLSTLVLATKGLEQGGSSESPLTDKLE
jgi:hypothetical protein